jgi:hypothetical protein
MTRRKLRTVDLVGGLFMAKLVPGPTPIVRLQQMLPQGDQECPSAGQAGATTLTEKNEVSFFYLVFPPSFFSSWWQSDVSMANSLLALWSTTQLKKGFCVVAVLGSLAGQPNRAARWTKVPTCLLDLTNNQKSKKS